MSLIFAGKLFCLGILFQLVCPMTTFKSEPNSIYTGEKEPCPYGKEGVYPNCFGMYWF